MALRVLVVALLLAAPPAPDAARAFLRFLAGPAAQARLAAAGLEP
jgi:ABC-type Fe3+ transport system substrate-binding protein